MAHSINNKIYFHFLYSGFTLSNRNQLKQFILKQLRKEKRDVDTINYIFCDDAYLLQLNQEHLQHDTLTDIITFELSPPGAPLVADVYISVERVRENAILFTNSLKKELHRVIFHGALHLAGYKDKNPRQEKQMRQMEEQWLNLYFVPRGTAAKN